jgi:hypothetical protein
MTRFINMSEEEFNQACQEAWQEGYNKGYSEGNSDKVILSNRDTSTTCEPNIFNTFLPVECTFKKGDKAIIRSFTDWYGQNPSDYIKKKLLNQKVTIDAVISLHEIEIEYNKEIYTFSSKDLQKVT